MRKNRFLSILLLVFFSVTFFSPLSGGVSSPAASTVANLHGANVRLVQGVPYNGVVPLSGAGMGSSMLQFRAGGHMLGFQRNKAYFAALDHALSVEFLGTPGVMPESSGPAQVKGKMPGALPLGKVVYRDLWKGITLTYEPVKGGVAESTYHIAPGADVSKIRLRYNVPVKIQKDGSLKMKFNGGFLASLPPWHGRR
jgi:hypothetical protein